MRTAWTLPVVVLVALAPLLAGCGDPEPTTPGTPGIDAPDGPTEIRVTADRDGASTALKVGHVLRVELSANPLNGYAWEVESVDESVLRIPMEEYLPPDTEGEAGTSVWRFEAIGAGSTTLQLRYVKFGEDLPTTESTFRFRVLVD